MIYGMQYNRYEKNVQIGMSTTKILRPAYNTLT